MFFAQPCPSSPGQHLQYISLIHLSPHFSFPHFSFPHSISTSLSLLIFMFLCLCVQAASTSTSWSRWVTCRHSSACGSCSSLSVCFLSTSTPYHQPQHHPTPGPSDRPHYSFSLYPCTHLLLILSLLIFLALEKIYTKKI